MTNILVVDDDINILQLVRIHLSKTGFNVLEAKDGNAALTVLQNYKCDLAVVDVMMPFMDGFELTKKIRLTYDIPVILLTAKSQLKDKEKGFRSGTDDYLIKPFEPKELIFRVEALLRRYNRDLDNDAIHIGNVVVNKKSYDVQIGNRTLLLPLKEFELLYVLASHPAQVFTRSHLIEQVWGIDYEGDERTVDVHIKRIRERFTKLTDDFEIKTVRGIGYSLEAKQR